MPTPTNPQATERSMPIAEDVPHSQSIEGLFQEKEWIISDPKQKKCLEELSENLGKLSENLVELYEEVEKLSKDEKLSEYEKLSIKKEEELVNLEIVLYPYMENKDIGYTYNKIITYLSIFHKGKIASFLKSFNWVIGKHEYTYPPREIANMLLFAGVGYGLMKNKKIDEVSEYMKDAYSCIKIEVSKNSPLKAKDIVECMDILELLTDEFIPSTLLVLKEEIDNLSDQELPEPPQMI